MILEDEAARIYDLLSNIRMVDILVDAFKREVDSSTLMYNTGTISYPNDHIDHEIYGRVKESRINDVVMALRQRWHNRGLLEIYSGDTEEILRKGDSDSVFCSKTCYLHAGIKENVVYKGGNKDIFIYHIRVNIPNGIEIPSEKAR